MSFARRYNTIVNVQNFNHNMSWLELRDMFAQFGTIKSCAILDNPYAERPRFGYVAFEDPDAAEDAIIELNGQRVNDDDDGKRLRVRRTHKKHPSPPKPKPRQAKATIIEERPKNPNDGLEIFVKNFGDAVDTEGLRRFFGRFGTIASARIIMENGRSKGYGFVTFTSPEAAASAVGLRNGRLLGTKALHVALARGKDPNKEPRVFPDQRPPQSHAAQSRPHCDHAVMRLTQLTELRRLNDDFFGTRAGSWRDRPF